MNTKTAWGLAACLLLPLCVGCSMGPEVIRAQSPHGEVYGPSHHHVGPATLMGHGDHLPPGSPHNTLYFNKQHGHHHAGPPHGIGGPGCEVGHGWDDHCHGHYGRPGMFGHMSHHGWHPTHRHYFSYHAPRHLEYPEPNQPAAVVQYPYYTVKGPDDFFLK